MDPNRQARDAWDSNAAFWDREMGDGNAFFSGLIWPATLDLLDPSPGERVLDVACGAGVSCRHLARLGLRVLGADFSEAMIEAARARGDEGGLIEYAVLDATDEAALTARGRFDAVLCNMALFDMADVRPLFRAVARLLGPGGRFVFSLLHPCFNNPFVALTAELEDRDGELVTRRAVKVHGYATAARRLGVAMPGQPAPHPYFHRSLTDLLGAAFDAGLVLDGLLERAFPEGHEVPLTWRGLSEIPPVVVARVRPR